MASGSHVDEWRTTVCVAVVSVAANVATLSLLGVRHGQDTMQFWTGASHLLAGSPLTDKEPSYLGYIALLAASRAAGMGGRAVVAFQCAVAAAATVAVYQLSQRLAGRRAGVLAAVFFSLDVDIATPK